MKRIVGILLVLVGLAFLGNKLIVKELVRANIEKTNQTYEDLDRETLVSSCDISCSYDFSDVEDIEFSKTYLDLNPEDLDHIIGELSIASLDIKVVLFEGISKEKLWKGVSTMKEGQLMGEGNYSIAGHYGINGELFYNLVDMEEGEDIVLSNKDKVFIYEAVDKVLVPPTALYMIEDSQTDQYGGPIISLMSCHYEDGKNTGQRIFVIGRLKEVLDYEDYQGGA